MKSSQRTRLNIYVPTDDARRLKQLASVRRVAKSLIVATALSAYLLPDKEDRRDVAITKRLDRLAQHLERIERDQSILIEALALFIRYELSVSTSVPEAHQEAVRAQGKARFEKFIAQLARHLQRGGSLLRDLHAEIYPEVARSNDTTNGTGDGSGSTP